MPHNPRNDPYGAFNFIVEIDGLGLVGFAEVTGLQVETGIFEYRVGSGDTTLKLPGLTKYTNIVLKRGYTESKELWQWMKATVDGQPERRNGTIKMLDETGQTVQQFEFFDGWPSRYEGPHFDAQNSAVAIETLEITHERLNLVS